VIRRFFSNRIAVMSGGCILLFFVWTIIGPMVLASSPTKINLSARFSPPSLSHIGGTDNLGRDVFARVTLGCRVAVKVSMGAVVFSSILGSMFGLISGYFRGRIDAVLMRIMDVFFAIPSVILAIALVAFMGNSLTNVIIAIGIVYVPQVARVVRGATLRVREEDYVLAAKAIGGSDFHIIFKHVLRNTLPIVVSISTLYLGGAILYEATLSYLGMGVPIAALSWGRILNDARNYINTAPHTVFVAGGAIIFVVLNLNLLGDQLRDILDPKLRGSK